MFSAFFSPFYICTYVLVGQRYQDHVLVAPLECWFLFRVTPFRGPIVESLNWLFQRIQKLSAEALSMFEVSAESHINTIARWRQESLKDYDGCCHEIKDLDAKLRDEFHNSKELQQQHEENQRNNLILQQNSGLQGKREHIVICNICFYLWLKAQVYKR